MAVTLYERERGLVKVQALQEKGEDNKYNYVINGFVDGELVETKAVEGGYKPQASAARELFRVMCEKYNPAVAKKEKAESTREPKAYTAKEQAKEIARLERALERVKAAPIVEEPVEAPADAIGETEAQAAE